MPLIIWPTYLYNILSTRTSGRSRSVSQKESRRSYPPSTAASHHATIATRDPTIVVSTLRPSRPDSHGIVPPIIDRIRNPEKIDKIVAVDPNRPRVSLQVRQAPRFLIGADKMDRNIFVSPLFGIRLMPVMGGLILRTWLAGKGGKSWTFHLKCANNDALYHGCVWPSKGRIVIGRSGGSQSIGVHETRILGST